MKRYGKKGDWKIGEKRTNEKVGSSYERGERVKGLERGMSRGK